MGWKKSRNTDNTQEFGNPSVLAASNRPAYKILALSFFALITLVPLLSGIVYAIQYSFGWAGVISDGFTFAHWSKFWDSSEPYLSLGFSLYVTVVSLFIALAVAVYLSLKASQLFKKGLLSYLIYFPLAFPAIVTALFIFQQLSKAGFLSRILYHIGLIDQLDHFPDLVNDTFGIGIILSHVLLAMPFFVLYFVSLIQNEQIHAHIEIAKTLGANTHAILREVTLPILLRKAWSTILLYAIFIMGSYEIPLILGRQSPQMISVMTVRNLKHFDLTNIPQAYIMAVLYTALILIVVFFSMRKERSIVGG